MRWVAKAKAEIRNSHTTHRRIDATMSKYKIFDVLDALKHLRHEAATFSERKAWIEADRHFRCCNLKAVNVKKAKR